jgi:hypothetical protein
VIDFRYHVVSIVAVFLALALGLFLGSTTLQGRVFDDLKGRTNQLSHQRDALSAQLGAANDRLKSDQAFDKALLPYAVSGRLSGQLVSVISAPGTSDATRKQVIAAIEAAGGTLSADVRLQNAIVAPQQDAFLAALTERVAIPGHPADASADGAERAAAQLAAVLGVRPSAHALSATTTETVLSAYSTGKLISVANTTATPRAGTLAVVLTGPAPVAGTDAATVKAAQTFLVDLLRDLDLTSLGAVVATPMPAVGASSDAGEAAAAAGLTKQVSTVTGVDTPAGQIATVFALAAQVDGVAGRFGLTQQGSPLPVASGAP